MKTIIIISIILLAYGFVMYFIKIKKEKFILGWLDLLISSSPPETGYKNFIYEELTKTIILRKSDLKKYNELWDKFNERFKNVSF